MSGAVGVRLNTILHGNVLDKLREIPDSSVDCCITSPPYWGLRDYKTKNIIWDSVNGCDHEWGTRQLHPTRGKMGNVKQTVAVNANHGEFQPVVIDSHLCTKCNAWRGSLGLEPTFNLYIKHLVQIFDEVRRILKPAGALWVNIGDTYNGTKVGYTYGLYKDGRPNKQQWMKGAEVYDNDHKKEKIDSISEKSLCGIPARFQIAMIDNGWVNRNTIIWKKRNCMPSSAKDRFTVDFEYLYFFTKSPRYYFETQYEPIGESTLDREMYSRIVKDGKSAGHSDLYSVRTVHDCRSSVTLDGLGRIKRCVWEINTVPFKGSHFAVFPQKLVETPIKSTCPEYICKKCGLPRNLVYEEIRVNMENRSAESKNWNETIADGRQPHSFHKPRKPVVEDDDIDDILAYNDILVVDNRPPRVKKFHPFGGAHKAAGYGNRTYSGKDWLPVTRRLKSMGADSNGEYDGESTKDYDEHMAQDASDTKRSILESYKKRANSQLVMTDCGCNAGFDSGVVLDPFIGSGTVGLVALQLGRSFIGIELNQSYIDMAMKRLRPYILQERLLL